MEAAAAVVLMLKGCGFGACKHSARVVCRVYRFRAVRAWKETQRKTERERDSDIYICTYIYIYRYTHVVSYVSLRSQARICQTCPPADARRLRAVCRALQWSTELQRAGSELSGFRVYGAYRAVLGL